MVCLFTVVIDEEVVDAAKTGYFTELREFRKCKQVIVPIKDPLMGIAGPWKEEIVFLISTQGDECLSLCPADRLLELLTESLTQ